MTFNFLTLLSKPQHSPFWDLAFRPLFIAGSAASIVSLSVWLFILNGQLTWQGEISATLWHVHEMLFGFALTIAVGFLMTAVQTWTNLRSLHGYSLVALVLIWLSIRVLLIQNTANMLTIMLLQASWWAIVIFKLGQLLITANSQRNYKILPLLCIIACLHLSFLYCSFTQNIQMALHLAHSTILFFSIIVSLISSRVIPMFTRNGVNRDGSTAAKQCVANKMSATPQLDTYLFAASLLGASLFFINGISANTSWSLSEFLNVNPVGILTIIGLMHIYRLSHWAPQATFTLPLLWSLHASYLFLGLGLILAGISGYVEFIRFADAMHLITVGTLGGMILAMICRVSLGHTGRPLKVKPLVSVAFMFMLLATVARFLLPLIHQPLIGWNVSALLWIAAFSIFIYHYTPILLRPKM